MLPAQQLRDRLAERGLARVLAEGGHGLLTDLLAADLVDELCLTTSPLLVAGPGITRGEAETLVLAGALTAAGVTATVLRTKAFTRRAASSHRASPVS